MRFSVEFVMSLICALRVKVVAYCGNIQRIYAPKDMPPSIRGDRFFLQNPQMGFVKFSLDSYNLLFKKLLFREGNRILKQNFLLLNRHTTKYPQ